MEVAVAYHWMNSHLVRSACSRSTGGRSPLPCNILYCAFRVQGILAATQSTGREDTREVGDTGKVGIAMTAIYPRQVVGGTCCKVLAPALQMEVEGCPRDEQDWQVECSSRFPCPSLPLQDPS